MMEDKNQKIKSISISSNATILDALKMMDATYKRLLLVFENEKFINVLSVGDIQRSIIRNLSLNTPLNNILRKETRLSKVGDSFPEIKKKMLKYRTECMPVLDGHNNLIDVFFWEDVFPPEEIRNNKKLDLPVVIMAGGKGTRLKPITNILPKALIPIGEKTILEDIMKRFTQIGSNSFFLSVNFKAEMIKHYFDTLNSKEYNISYIKEDKPLGTAGSLYLLNNKINQTFFVTNCDIIIEEDYSEIYNYHKINQNELTIVAALKHYPIPYGTIQSGDNGLLESLTEKPELTFKINSGMYILEPHLLNEIPQNEFYHITHLIEKLLKENRKVGVFPVSEGSWKDIGEWQEYLSLIKA